MHDCSLLSVIIIVVKKLDRLHVMNEYRNKIKKYLRIFIPLSFLFLITTSESMLLEYDAIVSVVEPWVAKKELAEEYMQESADLRVPKKIVESHRLKALFDAHEARVTLYEPFAVYCITYDLFLSCIEVCSSLKGRSDDFFEIIAMEKDKKEKCSLQ